MTYHWIKQNGAAELLIFFAGWGMDPTPFQFLEAGDRDVLMCYDYTEPELPLDHHALFADYAQVDLAAWSLGVPVANAAFHGEGTRFRSAVAINGSASPIHDDYGIRQPFLTGRWTLSTPRGCSDSVAGSARAAATWNALTARCPGATWHHSPQNSWPCVTASPDSWPTTASSLAPWWAKGI
jgi:hypothetical protein